MEYPIITIGREIGSGGLTIAKKLSENLGFKLYDKELLTEAARESGLDVAVFKERDETQTFCFMQKAMNLLFAPNTNYLGNENIFKIQSETIMKLAQKESCIFVGRCADYILRENSKLFSIFFWAEVEDRAKNIMTKCNVSEQEALKIIEKTDKNRSAYYNFYTNKTWGKATSYDMCINTSLLGVEKTADFVLKILKDWDFR